LLTAQGDHSLLAITRHQKNCLRYWAQLARVVKTGRPAKAPPSVRGEAAKVFGHQTRRDHVALLDDELRQQINARIATRWTRGVAQFFVGRAGGRQTLLPYVPDEGRPRRGHADGDGAQSLFSGLETV
jgi:hypothetical protein